MNDVSRGLIIAIVAEKGGQVNLHLRLTFLLS